MLLVGLIGAIVVVVALGSMLGAGRRRSRPGSTDAGAYMDAGSSDSGYDGHDHSGGADGGDGGDGGGDGGGD